MICFLLVVRLNIVRGAAVLANIGGHLAVA